MGKKQHSKDRLYLTTKEWKEEWGGNRGPREVPFTKLPFYCCAITFTPFEDPVCSPDGCVFDIVHAMPYIRKFHRHPVSGEPLEVRDLIQLKFHKNSDGEYHCPVMNKVFTEHTHIVAIKSSGNVYCYEAVNELNVKARNWKDLLSDEVFTRKDIIHIQDPLNFQNKIVNEFEHVKKQLSVGDAQQADETPQDSVFRTVTDDTRRVLETLGTPASKSAFDSGGGGKAAEAIRSLAAEKSKKEVAAQRKSEGKKPDEQQGKGDWRLRAPKRERVPTFKPGANTWDTDDYANPEDESKKKRKKNRQETETSTEPKAFDANGAKANPKEAYEKHVKYETAMETTGGMSRSFTSTIMNPQTVNSRVLMRVDRNPKKKGYLKMHTNMGDINIELRCDVAPRTCENFIGLCQMGYYDGLVFHRSIKNFMIQGGDPTGTGKGGESIYGPTFKDEIDQRLTHSGKGILSMANSGPHTNGSQFFILYKSAHHLDQKHTVFGKVVGGFDVLVRMEKVETDEEDRPREDITIKSVTVFVDPYAELIEEERQKEEEKQRIESQVLDDDKGLWFTDPGAKTRAELPDANTARPSGVGKYLNLPQDRTIDIEGASDFGKSVDGMPKKVKGKAKQKTVFGNFDNW
ncbi:hypothetical protein BSKO_09431 [Bryopsis sp. KO-2023]|nr:hypothetical protein BSKO_09431 [Bryopsis sp. KO-2023]